MIQLPNKPQGKPELKLVNKEDKPAHFLNAQGFGKAGNNAISIMIAQGHFKGEANLELELEAYKGLTKAIYKADLEAQKELKEEL